MNDKNHTESEEKDENTIIAERRSKLAAIRGKGIAFPNDFRPQHKAADLHEQYGEAERESLENQNVHVVVAGRMMLKRVMGKASFATLQDASGLRADGRIQLYITTEARCLKPRQVNYLLKSAHCVCSPNHCALCQINFMVCLIRKPNIGNAMLI